jgi:glycosyltransferase involved in cell wall biosynthesis
MRHADAIVGVSHFVARSLIDGGCPPTRVYAVPNSLDASAWDPTLDGRPTRLALGIPEGAPVLGIVSRLFSWKGHGDLLDALAVVKREIPDVRLVVVGEDDPAIDPARGSYRAKLEAQVQSLGLEANVIFTGFRTDIASLMAAFDVYVMPSWEEPFGMVFLEAMAMRKPVVAWASGGVPEVVEHDRTGLLVEPKSIPSLAGAIRRLLLDPALRRGFGEVGRRRVEEVFSPQRMCQEMLEVYQSMLHSPRTAAGKGRPSSLPSGQKLDSACEV